MNILAISGSLRTNSSNGAILRAVQHLAPANVEFKIYEGLADLPHFSPDLDDDAIPPVKHARELLQKADAVLICTPEYAFGIPGALKNLLDWTVSSAEFMDKPTAVITASPTSGEKAHAALLLVLSALSAQLIEPASIKLQFNRTKLNAAGEVADPAILEELQKSLTALLQAKQPTTLE